jgi:hypothetical protein
MLVSTTIVCVSTYGEDAPALFELLPDCRSDLFGGEYFRLNFINNAESLVAGIRHTVGSST